MKMTIKTINEAANAKYPDSEELRDAFSEGMIEAIKTSNNIRKNFAIMETAACFAKLIPGEIIKL